MSQFALKTRLPAYLRTEQQRITKIAEDFGLDFFPTIFEMTTYDQMSELAAFGGFPGPPFFILLVLLVQRQARLS